MKPVENLEQIRSLQLTIYDPTNKLGYEIGDQDWKENLRRFYVVPVVKNSTSQVSGALAVVCDCSERYTAEKPLKAELNELKKELASEDRLISLLFLKSCSVADRLQT